MDKLEIMVRLACAAMTNSKDVYASATAESLAEYADELIEAAGKNEEVPTKGTEIERWLVIAANGSGNESLWYTQDGAKKAQHTADMNAPSGSPHRVVRLTGMVE